MNEKFNLFREKYSKIIYKNYKIVDKDECIEIIYEFEIPGLSSFKPYIVISKRYILNNMIDNNLLEAIVFRIGLIELISYYKCVCPKAIVIEAGYIDQYEQAWFKKLFFNGLGEFFHVNNIKISEDDLFSFIVMGKKIEFKDVKFNGSGNLIPIGGGKDSNVTL